MASRTALLETIANRLLARREQLAEEMTERIRAAVTEFSGFDGAELWEAVRVSCLANIDAGLGSMARDQALPEAIPADARELALLTARLDLPLAALLRSYRIGHAMTWRLWLDEVEREDPEAEVRSETLAAASDYLFEYVDRLASFVTDDYTAERDRLMRSREQRRTQLVRDILDGADPQPGVALGELDYDLRLEHLACVVSGPDAEIAVRALAGELGAARQLMVSLTGETSWAWIGRVRPFRVPERIPVPEGTTLAIGDPASGTEGFRISHRQARDAHRVAVRGRQGAVIRYDDVALESLVGDEARSGAFVSRELRGIDGHDARSQRLRRTLRAYFASSQNASAAAALLGVHEHTVAYRLRTIEERLGRPVTARRAELETALRLMELNERDFV
ncbi:MAG: hypothetical protein QOI10_1573 [Solirubrobacterales bacterium]|jgi:hypothetical protein|nr:hypothetical protein [Solirubrobacterales bacterium]